MPNFKASVVVSLRPSVLDPAGEATKSAASRLGVTGVEKIRIGKSINLELQAQDESEARSKVSLLSERLLSNPVIENWSMEITISSLSN